jgi:outer membrane protein TolC
VRIVAHLSDAVFAPRVAEQKVQGSQFDAAATHNLVLLNVANAYLGLIGAEAKLLALAQSEKEIAEVAKLTADFAAKGIGRDADAMRAQSERLLLQSTMQRGEEEIVARATELARLLSTDPVVRLRPQAGTPPIIQMVDERMPLESLLQTALLNRPEIGSQNSNVALNETRLRQERIRPFLPTLSVGFSAGDYGGGSNLVGYRFSHFNTRTDFDFLAVWNLQNLGMGNRAVQNRVRAEIGVAEAQRTQVINQIHREVAEAFATARTSRHQLDISKRQVETAQQAFRQDLLRTKDRLGNLIEVLGSFNQLTRARQDLIQAMIDYSQAQFELYVAVGNTPIGPTVAGDK